MVDLKRYLAIGLGLAVGGAAWSGAFAGPQALAVRVASAGKDARIVVEFSENVTYDVFVLADPYRVVVDLPEVSWAPEAADANRSVGAISGLRYGLFRPGASRIVVDLKRPMAVVDGVLLAPRAGTANWRLQLRLAPVSRQAFLAALRKPRPPVPLPAIAPRPRVDQRKTVVIDPGHGGVDPGARGTSGVDEKEVALAVAREVRDALVASGRYRVVLTRDRDVFLPLAERVRIARANAADLFLSVHADSIGDPSIRGATVYTLSETASDRAAELLAAKENRADIIAGLDLAGESDDVTAILIDLAQRETMNHAASFAQLLLAELGDRLSQPRQPHRFAGFKVLKAPDVPSALVELGYLSNRRDEAMLTSSKRRSKINEAVVAAVDRFFAQQRASSR